MAIVGLKIIGESINDSVPATHQFYETDDFDAIRELAGSQEASGAAYLDVNVGSRPAAVMERAVRSAMAGSGLPLSIDSPDPELAAAGLAAYDLTRGKPILNSISPLRTEMFDLVKIAPFRPILLISEMVGSGGEGGPCRTAEETYDAAVFLFEKAKSVGLANDDLIFDPGIAPIGGDTEGNLARLLTALEMIGRNPEMKGVHASVGLSNFTVMLPPKKKDGSPVKGPLESAFLTRAMPLGLDHVIGSVRRKYRILDEGDSALICLDGCRAAAGMGSLKLVRKFYRG